MDDIVGIVLFSLIVTIAGFVAGAGIRPDALLEALQEIGGAAGLGVRAPQVYGWFGLALMPQGGVAIGLSLAAAMRFPEAGRVVLDLAVVGTVIFELVGPVCTRQALLRTPEEATAAPSLP